MPSPDVALLPAATILLSVAGIQHGPHFDPIAVAILFGLVIGVALMLLLGLGAGLGCVVAAFIRGASFGKSALLGIGVTTCAGLACIFSTFLVAPSLVAYTVISLASLAILVVLVHRSGDPSPGKRALIGMGAIIGIGIACSAVALISSLLDSVPTVLTIIFAATVILVIAVHQIGLNSPR